MIDLIKPKNLFIYLFIVLSADQNRKWLTGNLVIVIKECCFCPSIFFVELSQVTVA